MYIPDKIKIVGIGYAGKAASRFEIRSNDPGHEDEPVSFVAASFVFDQRGHVSASIGYMRDSMHDNKRYDVAYSDHEVVLDIKFNVVEEPPK